MKFRRLRPVWWWRHRRACKANAAYLEAVCAEMDRREPVVVIDLTEQEPVFGRR